MAELLRRANDLSVLRIRLHRSGGRARESALPIVAFEFQRGLEDPQEVGTAPVSEIGLARSLRGAEGPGDFSLPPDIGREIAQAAAGEPTVWLEFPPPCGYLRLVPWEHLLARARALDAAVLRLPYFVLLPRAADHEYELAVVASSVRAKAPFNAVDLIRGFLDGVADLDADVHVFCDVEWYDGLYQTFAQRTRVHVHNPNRAAEFDLPRRTRRIEGSDEVRNPWLQWVMLELDGRALDVVHFITHGYFAQDRGAIALASSPLINTDRQYARFVGAAELGAFLTAMGAWSVGFTGPDYNFAPLGLRELADSLAQTRPLHVLHTESEQGLHDAYELLLAAEPRPAPRLRNSELWVHPHLVVKPEERVAGGDAWLDDAGRTLVLGSSTEEALTRGVTPGWIAAGTRAIEQIHAGLLGPLAADQSPPLAGASGADIEFALREAADLLDRHVRAAHEPMA